MNKPLNINKYKLNIECWYFELTEKEKEPDKEKNKKDAQGLFYNMPHYMKLYEVFKGAYSNYQVKHRNQFCLSTSKVKYKYQFFCPLLWCLQ